MMEQQAEYVGPRVTNSLPDPAIIS